MLTTSFLAGEPGLKPESVNILLVEDDEVDAEFVRRGFRRHRIANTILRVRDGVEALQCLQGKGDFAQSLARPYLILLDLKLPRMDGLEFLQELRDDSQLRGSVVFVLTTSSDDRDLNAAYDLNAAGYILKSRVAEDFLRLVSLFDSYWRIIEFQV